MKKYTKADYLQYISSPSHTVESTDIALYLLTHTLLENHTTDVHDYK